MEVGASPILPSSVVPVFQGQPSDGVQPPSQRYQPQSMTSEEFATLEALEFHLMPPGQLNLHPTAVASSADRMLFFPNQLGGTSMPRNASFLRSGLQLLNWDALRFYSTFYFELNEVQQDFLLRAIQVAGDEHWPQVAAAEWLAEIGALMAEAASAASVSTGFALEQEKVEAKGDGSSLCWFGLDGAVSG